MINSGAFNYINVLQKAADASWTRNNLITNNIANVDTPNYKRRDIQFESYLMSALSGGDSLDANIRNMDVNAIEGTIYVDQSGASYRIDGNNVNIDTENAELAKNQIRYNTLLDSMTQEFTRIRAVLAK